MSSALLSVSLHERVHRGNAGMDYENRVSHVVSLFAGCHMLKLKVRLSLAVSNEERDFQ
jgi:hypothetical protein